MNRRARWFLLIAMVALLLVAGSLGGALAQDAAEEPSGDVVPASECTAEPRSMTFLSDLVATPAAVITPTPLAEFPEGAALDEAQEAEVVAAVHQLIACSNSGDLLRALALYSDDYLRRTLNPSGALTPEDALALSQRASTPIALTESQLIRLVAIERMTLLDDGQVALLLVTDGGPTDAAGVTVDYFVWKQVDGRWLADVAVSNADHLRSSATPTP